MPSVVLNGPKRNTTSILTRSESLRSEVSDASQNKKVSFNKDVRIRRIPQNTGIVGQVLAVLEPKTQTLGQPLPAHGCLWINSKVKQSEYVEQDLLQEATTVLNSVDKIQCTNSPIESHNGNRFLGRSKSELGFRRSQSEPPVSTFLHLGLRSSRIDSYNQPVRLKKPRRRIGLEGIADSSSSGSEPKESPLSSVSSGERDMATQTRYSTSPQVSVTKFGSLKRESAESLLRSPSSFLEATNGNTHNNNQPFSYTSRNSTLESRQNSRGGLSPREVIYAQVVSREKKDGTPEKRTIHKKYSDMTTSTTASDNSPADCQKHIRHFVYDKENWKNLNNATDTSNLLSNYKSRYGSKSNVTTVLLNNDDEDSLRSTMITNNDLIHKQSSRSSSSPPKLRDRPFFYGDTRRVKAFDHSSSSSPQYQYSSSSREQSPAGVLRKPVTVPSPPKLVSTASRSHTDYQYMTNKMGYLTPSEYSVDEARLPPRPDHRHRPSSMDRVAPKYEQIKANGWSRSTTSMNTDQLKVNGSLRNQTTPNGYTNYPTYASVEKNRKNSDQSPILKRTESKNGSANGGSGGLISSLMRRTKDKTKVTKDKNPSTTNGGGTPAGKVKPRNKFLSLFFDSKNTTNKKTPNPRMTSNQGKTKHIVTDSEIDDAERKRDGEYHSWSSVDDYRVDHRHSVNQEQKEKLSRGKSYNYGKIPEDHSYERDKETDYRHGMATQYKSATLGRPEERMTHDAIASRSKSLDRRTVRPDRFDPPKLVVTPSSPPVNETEYSWEPRYKQKSSSLSKSSVELDRHNYVPYQNGRSEASSTKLRYFGDTDAESGVGNSTGHLPTSRFDTYSFQNGKMDQGYPSNRLPGSGHVKKGRNDGLSSEESESRFSKSSSRSVFLHAPTIAEIPPPGGLQRRTLSKDEISNYSGPQKQTRHLARSMSVLAPWRPRPSNEKYEVRYDSEGYNDKYRRPPKPPRSPNQRSMSPTLQSIQRHSESTEHLLQPTPKPKEPIKAATLGRVGGTLKRSKSMANEDPGSNWFRRKEIQRK